MYHCDNVFSSKYLEAWNMGNAAPPSDMACWLPKDGGGYDIIAIGLQESTFIMKDPSAAGLSANTFFIFMHELH
jgi:hypothetical protein